MNYYKKIIYIPKVDKNDNLIGKIERWEAHEKNILHRGFTTIIKVNKYYILQLRKHIIFDNLFDLSFSSHPIFKNNQLEDIKKTIIDTLKREWVIDEENFKIDFIKKYHYQEKDEKSNMFENEINYLFLLNLNKLPKINLEFSYKMIPLTKEELIKNFSKYNFVPWIKNIDLNELKNIL